MIPSLKEYYYGLQNSEFKSDVLIISSYQIHCNRGYKENSHTFLLLTNVVGRHKLNANISFYFLKGIY
tara:strand:- start:2242 stop:2445 length:204 start_codon:yes stop_codon:yes gene_type:complete